MTLLELAGKIGAELTEGSPGAGGRVVDACASLEEAGPGQVSFLANQKYASQLPTTKAEGVIVGLEVQCPGLTLLRAKDPYFAFRNAMVELHGWRKHPAFEPESGGEDGISDLAVVHPSASIGPGTRIMPFAVICEDATIGANCVIYPQVFIGPRAKVGDDCQLFPSVTVYDDCTLGNRVTLHSGCVIGQDGFGYATHAGAHHKIPQSGNAVLEDDVEMGAGCTIDRATIGSTVIGKGTKFSDLVAIGHGTKVGMHNLLVAQVGLAGSVKTGKYVVLGGQSGAAGHLHIGDGVQAAAKTGIASDIEAGKIIGGVPAVDLSEAKRTIFLTRKLPDMLMKIKDLEREVAKLKKAMEPKAE